MLSIAAAKTKAEYDRRRSAGILPKAAHESLGEPDAGGEIDHTEADPGFRLPSQFPKAKTGNSTLDHLYAVGAGIEEFRDELVDATIHPIETLHGTATTIWDGLNAISDATLGLSDPNAKARNAQRGTALVSEWMDGDSVNKTKMATKGALMFGSFVSGRSQLKMRPNRLNSKMSSDHKTLQAAAVQVESFSTIGYLDGVLYPKDKLQALVRYLERRNVHVYATSGSPSFKAVRHGTHIIELPRNPTILQAKHELSRWLDFKRLGFDEYKKLTRFQREELVLLRLQNKEQFWNSLTRMEQEFSTQYVKSLKEGRQDAGLR